MRRAAEQRASLGQVSASVPTSSACSRGGEFPGCVPIGSVVASVPICLAHASAHGRSGASNGHFGRPQGSDRQDRAAFLRAPFPLAPPARTGMLPLRHPNSPRRVAPFSTREGRNGEWRRLDVRRRCRRWFAAAAIAFPCGPARVEAARVARHALCIRSRARPRMPIPGYSSIPGTRAVGEPCERCPRAWEALCPGPAAPRLRSPLLHPRRGAHRAGRPVGHGRGLEIAGRLARRRRARRSGRRAWPPALSRRRRQVRALPPAFGP